MQDIQYIKISTKYHFNSYQHSFNFHSISKHPSKSNLVGLCCSRDEK